MRRTPTQKSAPTAWGRSLDVVPVSYLVVVAAARFSWRRGSLIARSMTVRQMICRLRRSAAALRAVGVMSNPVSAAASSPCRRKPRDAPMISDEEGPRIRRRKEIGVRP